MRVWQLTDVIGVRMARLLLVLILVVASFAPILPVFNTKHATAANDLIAWWKLDEGTGTTAIDSSGNGNNGTLSNVTYSATTPPDVAFDDPYSAYFNSASTGRIISTPVSLNGYSEFTMAGWAYPTQANARASWFGQNDLFEFGFQDGDTLFCYTAKGQANWDFNPSTFLNKWHHITCLATSSQLIIYVDGLNVASVSISAGGFGSSGYNFSIGAGAVDAGTDGPFTGYIDDVRVYNRGLTPSEMDSLGTGSTGPTNGPSVAINAPTGDTNSWNPSVNWDSADTCEYKFGNGSWQTVDCAQAGADIPAPSEGSNVTLHIRGTYDGVDTPGETSLTFDYDQTDPTVDAGNNIQTNSSFTQSSANASDSNSGIASYAWSKQSGPGTVTFSNTNILNPVITAISTDGTYVLRLTVTDSVGNSSHDDFTIIWDTTSPDVSLSSFPDLFTNQTNANFGFSAVETVSTPVAFTCKLDSSSFNSCTSPKAYTALSEGEHTVTVRAADSVGNMQATSPYTWTVDVTAPEITRNGNASETVVQGQSYSDAGAIATDSVDGTITGQIVIANPVNTANTGTYVVRYNVTDRSGNAAAEVTRTVTVVSNADRNNDGTADALQNNVNGFTNEVNKKAVALEVDNSCDISDAIVKAESVNPEQDPDYDYPNGLFNFTLSCGTPGYTTTIKQYYYGVNPSGVVLRKYNPNTNTYFMLSGADITTAVIAGQTVTVVTYQVTDGGELDMDGEANGVIVDPAGLATEVTKVNTSPLADTGIDQVLPTFLSLAVIVSPIAYAVRKKRSVYRFSNRP